MLGLWSGHSKAMTMSWRFPFWFFLTVDGRCSVLWTTCLAQAAPISLLLPLVTSPSIVPALRADFSFESSVLSQEPEEHL